jgi:hypothetical protein
MTLQSRPLAISVLYKQIIITNLILSSPTSASQMKVEHMLNSIRIVYGMDVNKTSCVFIGLKAAEVTFERYTP